MDTKKAEAIIEAVLFAMGDSVELSKLTHVLEMEPQKIRDIIAKMNENIKRKTEESRLLNWKIPISCVQSLICMSI